MVHTRNEPVPTEVEREELGELLRALRTNTPEVTRRDILRWSAIAAGALTTTRFNTGLATATPRSGGNAAFAYQNEEIETDVTIQVPFNPFGQGVTLDPHRTINWLPFWIMFQNVWGGLVRYTETAEVELDLAESFEKSPDGLVYTFKIRPDAKYASGRPVLADHFIQSWRRALDPANTSPMAHFMEHVAGYQDFIDGNSEELGVRAIDDATVEVTLSKPYNFFLSYMAAFIWDVVDPDVLAEAGETDFVTQDAGTGPWRFTSFDPSTEFVMEPNTHHYRGNSPSIVQIVWPIVTGPTAENTALNLYKADEAVVTDVPLSLKAAVEQDPVLSKELNIISPSGSVRSLAMDFTKPPFDDVRVRRAFGMAIDRDKWANEIWQGTWAPAEFFTPPIVMTTTPYEPPAGLKYDPEQAKALLAEAGFPGGEGLPEIVLYWDSTAAPDEINRWRAFLQMFKDTLGVEVQLDSSKTQDQIQDLQVENAGRQFDIWWWGNITETPQLLSEVFRPDSPYMDGVFNWNVDLPAKGGFDPGADARKFAELMAQADIESDETTRNQLYLQGEELVLKNAVYVPMGNTVPMYVRKPYLKGAKQASWTGGAFPIWFDKDVVVVKH